jgi:hypothetical protein
VADRWPPAFYGLTPDEIAWGTHSGGHSSLRVQIVEFAAQLVVDITCLG